jgi:regulator of sigma E protease
MGPTFYIRAIQLLLSLSILVFFHEIGHLFFARLFKVRVEKFYLFFNPVFSLVRFKKIKGKWQFKFFKKNEKPLYTAAKDSQGNHIIDAKGNYLYDVIEKKDLNDDDWRKYPEVIEWGIGWLPVGGYCKIGGMVDESLDRSQMNLAPQPGDYRSVSPWKRLPIISGGVFVNFILALLIYSAVLFTWGESYIPIKYYKQGFEFSETAKKIGFKDGDLLLKADGEDLDRLDDNTLRKIINAKKVTVSRDGKLVNIAIPEDFMQSLLKGDKGFGLPRIPFIADEIMPQSPAIVAGFKQGDSLVSINGKSTPTFFDFVKTISQNKNKPISIEIYRNHQLKTIQVHTDTSGHIGIRPLSPEKIFGSKEIHYSLLSSIPAGFKLGISKLHGYVSDMKYLFTQEGVKSIGGFGSLGSLFSFEWDWQQFWSITAFLSVILAFMNILPIPALDGGHLLFLIVEIIRGKKPNEKFIEKAQIIGMMILLVIFLYANANDIIRHF